MTRVLLTGASGFIGAHVLRHLLEGGHSVVATVRSQAKADAIKKAYPETPSSKLDFAIVLDIAKEHAYDEAVKSDPPFEAVIHTASPFSFRVEDIQRDLLDPAIIGTTSILKSIKANAPSVKRVVITSSFAAVTKPVGVDYCFTDADWNPITAEAAILNGFNGYKASKTFAEKAAWDFVEKEHPNFTLTTLCATHVFGPIIHSVPSIKQVNTSSELVRDFIEGKFKTEIPPNPYWLWVDVRDTALAHIHAMEINGAIGKRFIISGGYFSHREIATILWNHFPLLRDKLPDENVKGGTYPEEGIPKFDNKPSVDILGIDYTSLEKSIVDQAHSLLGLNMV